MPVNSLPTLVCTQVFCVFCCYFLGVQQPAKHLKCTRLSCGHRLTVGSKGTRLSGGHRLTVGSKGARLSGGHRLTMGSKGQQYAFPPEARTDP